MRALAVYLGGKKLCTAGHKKGSISADVHLMSWRLGEHCFLNVKGIDGNTYDRLTWRRFHELKVGDEIRIVVEEVGRPDEPSDRKSAEEMDRRARNLGAKDPSGGSSKNSPKPHPLRLIAEMWDHLEPGERESIEELVRTARKRVMDEGLLKEPKND